MKQYIGTKTLNAKPMTRGEYNTLRGWAIPADENPVDAGYLVEYLDGGKANHPDFANYISWSPSDVFERSYKPTVASGDDVAIERACVRLYILLIGLAGMAVGISKHFFHRIKTTWSSNEQ